MTGQLAAFSVSREMEGKRGEDEEHKVRMVDVFVLARKGQEDLKRDKEQVSFSMDVIGSDPRCIIT
jgi:hypothetical protein